MGYGITYMDDDVRSRIRQARVEPRMGRPLTPGAPQAARSTVPMEGMNSVPAQMVGPTAQAPSQPYLAPQTVAPAQQPAYQQPQIQPTPQFQTPAPQQVPQQATPQVDPMSNVQRVPVPQPAMPQSPPAMQTSPIASPAATFAQPTPQFQTPVPQPQASTVAPIQPEPYTGPKLASVEPAPVPDNFAPTSHAPQQPLPSNNFAPGPEHKKSKKPLVVAAAIVGVVLLGGGGYFAWQQTHKVVKGSPASAKKVATIPVYNAKNLPDGYVQNNDLKALKSDVIYYSVSGPNKEVFYVTQQPIPAKFDFVAFNKKFANQLSFTTESGSAVIGQIGANMIGSVKTNKNTWVIINATNVTDLSALELVARSLQADR